jgi:hypothetical protein
MPGARCPIDLGQKTDPRSPRFRISLIRDSAIRTAIEGYLSIRGVELDRDAPPGWFQWLDPDETLFQTRCGDPPGSDAVDNGYQPFNYYVRAKLSKSILGNPRALGQDFFHETDLIPPSKCIA